MPPLAVPQSREAARRPRRERRSPPLPCPWPPPFWPLRGPREGRLPPMPARPPRPRAPPRAHRPPFASQPRGTPPTPRAPSPTRRRPQPWQRLPAHGGPPAGPRGARFVRGDLRPGARRVGGSLPPSAAALRAHRAPHCGRAAASPQRRTRSASHSRARALWHGSSAPASHGSRSRDAVGD